MQIKNFQGTRYIGARYIANDIVEIGVTGERVKKGDVVKCIPEWEAIGRHDFEPVYEHDIEKETKSKNEFPKKIKE